MGNFSRLVEGSARLISLNPVELNKYFHRVKNRETKITNEIIKRAEKISAYEGTYWLAEEDAVRTDSELMYKDSKGDISFCRYTKDGSKTIWHRRGGPAVIFHNRICWYRENKLHREDGPAVISDSSTKEFPSYYINGKKIPRDKYLQHFDDLEAGYSKLVNDYGLFPI